MTNAQNFRNPLYEGSSRLSSEDGDEWHSAKRSSITGEDCACHKQLLDARRIQTYRTVRMHVTEGARIRAIEDQEFCDNTLVTSKHNVITFLPMNLFQQFSRAANLYFLMNAVIQLIPGLSPTKFETTIVPLSIVLLLNALKEAHDDYKRHRSDAEVNKRKSEVLQGEGLKTLEWRSIIVGDIIRVQNNSEIPADMLCLSSSDPQGLAYLETTNLDGETNLKVRNSFYQSSMLNPEDGDMSFHGLSGLIIECEQPNNRLYEFEGFVSFQGQGLIPLDVSQILLRGATLRNTQWVIGAVIFTGADTKYMKNMVAAPRKVSQMESKTNILVTALFIYQLILCVGLAIGHFMWRADNLNHFYLAAVYVWPEPGLNLTGLFVQLLRFIILLDSLIPISLYVTLELVKVIQCWFIQWDAQMVDKSIGDWPQTRTSNLNDELGQVQYVLSDKTGTLTQNVMTFVQCSINGVVYGNFTRDRFGEEPTGLGIHTISEDSYLMEELQNVDELPNSQSQKCKDFFLHLTVCHTVIPTYSEDDEIIYHSSSPDEEALVQGAAACGFKLIRRDPDMLTIECQGRFPESQTILAVLEFTSERKRMSIICKNSDGRIKLYCKGADTVILKRLAKDQGGIAEISLKHLEEFAHSGYRTLCIAEREIEEAEFEKWASRFRAASVASDDREQKLAEAADSIEREMVLLGVTAVEDKLQDGVKESVTLLSRAGIKIWVLTGDRLETAVAIALACNLLADSMHLFLLCESSCNSVPQLLPSMLDEAKQRAHERTSLETSDMAVIVEGESLSVALEENNRTNFLELCQECRTVIFCRVSPLQKALVTQMVKENNLAVTLAIGDGANDVAMIRAAHIGVGISGREGMAAVLASDYSIGQFRFLVRLLLIHGRWSYKRNKLLVMYSFYKNIVYVMGHCYFSFYSGLSAQSLYPTALISTYNLLWTCIPTFVLATLDQDVHQVTVMNNPQLYQDTQHDGIRSFFQDAGCWFLSAFWHSLVVFSFPFATVVTSSLNGESDGLFNLGVAVYTLAVVVVNVKLLLCSNNVTVFSIVSIWVLSIFGYLAFLPTLSYIGLKMSILNDLSDVGLKLYCSVSFWLMVLVGTVTAFLPDWVISKFLWQRRPSNYQVFQEIEKGWRDGVHHRGGSRFVEPLVGGEGTSEWQKSPVTEFEGQKGGKMHGSREDEAARARRMTWREVLSEGEGSAAQGAGAAESPWARRIHNAVEVVTRRSGPEKQLDAGTAGTGTGTGADADAETASAAAVAAPLLRL